MTVKGLIKNPPGKIGQGYQQSHDKRVNFSHVKYIFKVTVAIVVYNSYPFA